MKPVALAIAGSLLTIAAVTGSDVHAAPRQIMTATTFRLQVSGTPDPTSTFWVAYGPLAGHFGIVRLHPAAAGIYRTTVQLPAARGVFAYLQGRGVLHTRVGAVPGNPVVTIKVVHASTVRDQLFPVVRWEMPAG